jgi:XTP/dITP diphosphohydrolase
MDNNNSQQSFEKLVSILNDLRVKCPWDRKQTIQTLRPMTIEETYELADAILDEDWESIREELGDLMLHVVFYAKIADEMGRFSVSDVLEGISDKLIKRHPHVYPPEKKLDGIAEVKTEEDVKQNWEKLKLKEGKKSVLSGVPRSLPAVVKAMRLQEKAKQVGFEWENTADVWKKVEEESLELQEAVSDGDLKDQEEELGDLLFSLVNYARFLNIDPDAALERTNRKFIDRFTRMEERVTASGKTLHELSLKEMDQIWNSLKTTSP